MKAAIAPVSSFPVQLPASACITLPICIEEGLAGGCDATIIRRGVGVLQALVEMVL